MLYGDYEWYIITDNNLRNVIRYLKTIRRLIRGHYKIVCLSIKKKTGNVAFKFASISIFRAYDVLLFRRGLGSFVHRTLFSKLTLCLRLSHYKTILVDCIVVNKTGMFILIRARILYSITIETYVKNSMWLNDNFFTLSHYSVNRIIYF